MKHGFDKGCDNELYKYLLNYGEIIVDNSYYGVEEKDYKKNIIQHFFRNRIFKDCDVLFFLRQKDGVITDFFVLNDWIDD